MGEIISHPKNPNRFEYIPTDNRLNRLVGRAVSRIDRMQNPSLHTVATGAALAGLIVYGFSRGLAEDAVKNFKVEITKIREKEYGS
jgi:hypothetical protein